MRYRAELDGIRAIAVAGVLIFHLEQSLLTGGFLGVDVFFVLSGFLITTILYEQISQGVSIKHFWLRRARRILPALVGVVAFTLVIASALYLRHDRELLVGHATAALFSFSNFFVFFKTTGYWGVQSETLPLLHTWSLSIEEQFYFVFPFVLSFLFRSNQKLILRVLLFLAAGSFLLPFMFSSIFSSLFFLFPFSRVWELLIGSLLAVAQIQGRLKTFKSERWNYAIQLCSLLAIGASFLFIEVNGVFSNDLALVTCLATALLIFSIDQPSMIKTLLSSRFMVYLGKRSYSIYLYHWPIIVFWKLFESQPNFLLITAISLLCAEVSYQFVEKPFREQSNPFRSYLNWIPLLVMVSGYFLLLVFHHPFAVTKQLRSLSLDGISKIGSHQIDHFDGSEITGIPSYNWIASNRPDILLVGSSHAVSLFEELASFCGTQDLSLVSLARTSKGIYNDTLLNAARLDVASDLKPRIIILFSHWSGEIENNSNSTDIAEPLKKWSKLCDKLIVIDSPPKIVIERQLASLQEHLLYLYFRGFELKLNMLDQDTITLERVVGTIPNATWVSLGPLFSENGRSAFLPDGSIAYADKYHLNFLGSRYLIRERLGDLIIECLRSF